MEQVMELEQPGFDNRHRNKNGEISRKHGNTLIRTLRQRYGPTFAPGCTGTQQLSEVLATLDARSLAQLIRDHEAGTLAGHIKRHS
jgi:hypothetical protein